MSKIRICLLCGDNEANDTGSHIIPHFLLKSMVSTSPEKKRSANDLIFKLTEHGTDYHVARGVSQDQIESTFRRKVDEIDLTNNPDLFTVDNKWCTTCEKKFSELEGITSETYKKIENVSDDRIVTITNYSEAFRLLVYSILWRIAATHSLPNKISAAFESKLKKLLNDCLDLDRKQLLNNCAIYSGDINSIPILIGKTFNENPSANLVYAYSNKDPQTYILNDIIVNISEGQDFNFDKVFPSISTDDIKNAINHEDENLKFIIYTSEEYNEVRNDFLKMYVESRYKQLVHKFVSACETLRGFRPTQAQIDHFLKVYFDLNDQSPDFRDEILIKALMKVLYYP